jgi:hypothetical protein
LQRRVLKLRIKGLGWASTKSSGYRVVNGETAPPQHPGLNLPFQRTPPDWSQGKAAHESGFELYLPVEFYFANFLRIAPRQPINPLPKRIRADGSGVVAKVGPK